METCFDPFIHNKNKWIIIPESRFVVRKITSIPTFNQKNTAINGLALLAKTYQWNNNSDWPSQRCTVHPRDNLLSWEFSGPKTSVVWHWETLVSGGGSPW